MNFYKDFLFFSSAFLIFSGIIGRGKKETDTGAKISYHDTTIIRLQEAINARQPVFFPLQVIHSPRTKVEQAAFLEEHHEIVFNSNPSTSQQSTKRTARQRDRHMRRRGAVVKHPSLKYHIQHDEMDISTTDTLSEDLLSSSMSSGSKKRKSRKRHDTTDHSKEPRQHNKKTHSKNTNALPILRIPRSNFVIRLSFGTPPQEFLLVFDTGSSYVYVVGVECLAPTCINVNRYDRKKSTTARTNEAATLEETTFGTGTVDFFLMRDRIQLGSYILDDQVFAVITDERKREIEPYNVFENIHFEGIFGLGPSPEGTGFFDRVLALLPPDVPKQFGIYTANFNPEFLVEPYDVAACLFLGFFDNYFYEAPITYFPVENHGFWHVGLKEMWIGDIKLCCDEITTDVVFDSGTSFNTVPHDMIKELLAIFQTYNAKYKKSRGKFQLPNIVYKLEGGVDLVYTPDMYSLELDDKRRIPCYMGLDLPGAKKMFLLGALVHFRSYFTVFRYPDQYSSFPRIGVAKARHSHENILRIKKYDPGFK